MTMAIRVPTYFRVCAPFEYQGKDRDAVHSGEWVRVPAVERPPWMASIGLWLSPPGWTCGIDIGHVKDGNDIAKAFGFGYAVL